MNLEALIGELRARGFDYLSTTRCTSYLNDAYLLDVCEQEAWPFLGATKEGTAPLEIPLLRWVESVTNTTRDTKLKPLSRQAITDTYDTDLNTPGTPSFYYLEGDTTLRVYPANTTDTMLVRYWEAPEALEGTDTPALPSRFHSLIVDAAVARAYEDSDDFELAQNAAENFQRRLQAMRESLLVQTRDTPDQYVVMVDRGTDA